MDKFKGTKGDWNYEFREYSSISPNGETKIKAGSVGVPVANLPMPIGGINTQEINIENTQLKAAAPDHLKTADK